MMATLTRAEGAGKVILIKRSRDDGGTRRSPFLTAPFNRIGRALGEDRILIQQIKIKNVREVKEVDRPM